MQYNNKNNSAKKGLMSISKAAALKSIELFAGAGVSPRLLAKLEFKR
jgi:hypothetical protein